MLQYKIIGLMSGSSLDGVDVVYAHFYYDERMWGYEIPHAITYEYSQKLRDKLANASKLSAFDLLVFNNQYGKFLGEKINEFIKQHKIRKKDLFVASHGHTVFHSPNDKLTYQIGDAENISLKTNLPIIYDLRTRDICLGGQGAPIVPIGEKYLFPVVDLFLNIGGIANIASKEKKIAFDVCSANRVLNKLATLTGKAFDKNGMIARKGTINKSLLQQLNSLDYFKQSYPKTLSNQFGDEIIFPLVNSFKISVEDKLRTMTEHIAMQITNSVKNISNKKMMITGGGANNIFLVERIKFHTQKNKIAINIPSQQLVNFKEALIIAYMGVLFLRYEDNVLSSVTGAKRNSVCGKIVFPDK